MANTAVIVGVLAPAAATSGGIVFSNEIAWFDEFPPIHEIIHSYITELSSL